MILTELDSYLTAIEADPLNVQLRLVFADLLEDLGDERGAEIRKAWSLPFLPCRALLAENAEDAVESTSMYRDRFRRMSLLGEAGFTAFVELTKDLTFERLADLVNTMVNIRFTDQKPGMGTMVINVLFHSAQAADGPWSHKKAVTFLCEFKMADFNVWSVNESYLTCGLVTKEI